MTNQIEHKVGGDEFIENINDNYKIMNWGGFKIIFGRGKTPFFFNEIEERRHNNRANMIVITGSPGEGKSYLGLRLCQIFDKKFDVDKQIVFDRMHLLILLGDTSPLKRGQVILIDEAQFVAGSRRWYEEIQKDIMEHLEAVRSKGFIIIIVSLHLDLLDKIIRKYVLTYMINVQTRGTGIAYRLYTPVFESEMYKKRLGKVILSIPDAEKCKAIDCLRCNYADTCMTDRAKYERRKREFLAMKAKESIAEIQKKEVTKINNEDVEHWLTENCANRYEYTNRGTLKPIWIQQEVLKGMEIRLPLHRCIQVQRLHSALHGVATPLKK